MKNKRVLIAGGGLAGITMAYQLHERNIPFLLIDQGVNHSSSIAAGIINPIVFRRMLKSWRVDDFLPYAIDFYNKIGAYSNDIFFHFLPMRRGFAHEQEAELWESRQFLDEYNSYLTQISENDILNTSVINNYGTGKVMQSGFVDTNLFLEKSYLFLIKNELYLKTKYNYNEFDIQNCVFRGEAFEKIIFCEGYHGIDNPWFNYLPLQTTKGQTITIESNTLPSNEILNRKCFILPIKDTEHFKVGSTYEWDTTDLSITEEGLNSLKQNIDQLIDNQNKYSIIHQEAGIRPTVKDRRPLIGEHPTFKKCYIFNGLGTKGYLMAPLLSEELYKFMYEDISLDKEIDIKRIKLT
jgi:glycine oxidase